MTDELTSLAVSSDREHQKHTVITMVQAGESYAAIMSTLGITSVRLQRILRMKDVTETINSSNAIVRAEAARRTARLVESALDTLQGAVERGDVKAALGVLTQTKALESSGNTLGYEAANAGDTNAAIQVVVNVSGHKNVVDAEVE